MSLPRNAKLDQAFTLHVSTADVHVPRMWVEKDPDDRSHVSTRAIPEALMYMYMLWLVSAQACMLTFYPELDFNDATDNCVVIAVDCSNSMRGQPFSDAIKVRDS